MNTITEAQYQNAKVIRDDANNTINAYHKQRAEAFEQRMKDNPVFKDEELFYSASSLCPCGHGLAYPKECGPSHYWECSAVLKGVADMSLEHTGKLPFSMYDVKGESDHRGTTRGVFRPKG